MAQLQKKFLADNAVDENKIRLSNDAPLKARNAADSADVDILKVNASDRVEFSSVPQSTSDATAPNDLVRFSQLTGTTVTGGDMIDVTTGKVSVDLATNGGLKSTDPGQDDGQLEVSLEASNPSLQVDGSNGLGLKMATTGALSKGSGGVSVNTDGSTVDVNGSNQLEVKAGGVGTTQLANTSVTTDKIAAAAVDENKIASSALSTTGGLAGGSGTKLSVGVDGATTKINGSNQVEGLKDLEQKITLGSGDITNQYVDLAHAVYGADAANNSISLFVVGGPMQEKAVDYTVSLTGGSGGVTRVTFAGDLATGGNAALVSGDKLVIKYQYL